MPSIKTEGDNNNKKDPRLKCETNMTPEMTYQKRRLVYSLDKFQNDCINLQIGINIYKKVPVS
jgi:hypothetical protein